VLGAAPKTALKRSKARRICRSVHDRSRRRTLSCQSTWSQVWMPHSWPASRTERMTEAARRPMSGAGSKTP